VLHDADSPAPRPLVACSYNLHSRGYLWQDVKDQVQPIAIDLLNLAGNAAIPDMEDCPGMIRSPTLGAYMAQHTALPVCKMYQDPETLWVSRGRLK
jgi:hypothetical protein